MRNNQKIIKFNSRRIFCILAFEASLFTILIYRLFNLQILKHKQYLNSAENNYSRTITEPSQRGLILDLNGEILAENFYEYLLILDTKKITTIDGFITKIVNLLDISETQQDKIRNLYKKKKRFINIKSISFDDFISLQYQIDNLPELLVNKNYLRIYQYKEISAHVVGYVINENKKYDNNHFIYSHDFKVGKTGIEAKYNSQLTGENHITQIEVDARGNKIKEIQNIEGSNGQKIKTSINIDLQKMIYNETKDHTSSVVVIDIQKQNLVAMLSTPSFDPEILNNDELRKAHWGKLATDPNKPLINKAISGLYSPGSTFKIVVALAALELGIINEHSTIFCNGGHQVGNRFYHCLHHHGTMNVRQAIEKSCNSFFYALAKKMDISFLEKLCYSLGLGKISNIEFNGELQGIVPSKFWKFKRFGNLWYIGDSANLMIGQGYLTCTPLQLCTMVGSIASGNLMYLSTLDSTGHAIAEKNTLVSEKNLNIIRSSMFEVVNSPYSGTAYPSIGKKYKDLRISGKTGTVQISSGQKHKNHSVFVGFAPYDKPKYAVSVIGEFMGYGSSFAAPLAGKIFDFLKEN